MKYLPFFALFVCLLCFSTNTNGQVKVLVNEVPMDVDHTNGELLALYKKYPNFMDGYEKAPFDPFKKVQPRINDLNFATNDKKALQSRGEMNDNTQATPSNVTDNEKALKKSLKDKYIYFVGGTSNIDDKSLIKVKNFSEKIKNGESKSILIKGWYKMDNDSSQKLIQDRLEGCKFKLEEAGVPSNLILTSILGSNKESKYVSILLQ